MKRNTPNKGSTEFEVREEGVQKIPRLSADPIDVQRLVELIKVDDVEAVRAITNDSNFNFDITDDHGFLLIHIAAHHGAVGVLRYLIDKQGPVALTFTTRGIMHSMPLGIAAQRGHVEAVKLLLEHGADKEARDDGGWLATPLIDAVGQGHIAVVKLLLESGANKDACTDEGDDSTSALGMAIASYHLEIVKLLLESGVDIHNSHAISVTQLACKSNTPETMELLLERGATIPESIKGSKFPGELERICATTEGIRSICELKEARHHDFYGAENTYDFAIRVFKNCLITAGLPCDSYDEFKDRLTKLYAGKVPDTLLELLTKEVDSYKESTLSEIKVIEGVIFSHLHGISPMPYSEEIEAKKLDYDKATEETIKEYTLYREFWNNPSNAKYKIPGTKLLELATTESSLTYLIALTDLILRAIVIAESNSTLESGINILEDVNKRVLQLDKIVLVKEMKHAIGNVVKQYNEHKNNTVTKTLISHDNEIEIHKEMISDLEQGQKAQGNKIGEQAHKISEQAQKIMKLEHLVNNLYTHLGIDVKALDTPDSNEGAQGERIHVIGGCDNFGYHGELSS